MEENIDFKKACKQVGMGMEFDYTAQSFPQQNGKIKKVFITQFNKVSAVFSKMKFTTFFRKSLWAKAAINDTRLDNALVTSNKYLSPVQKCFGKGKKSILSLI